MNLVQALDDALQAAALADELMLKYYTASYSVEVKEGAYGRAEAILTEPDLLCDRLLVDYIGRRYPDTAVVSEESYLSLPRGWEHAEYTWYIDPIDGSLSYLEKTGNFGVSIGLVHNGRPVLGVITNPVMNLTAWAAEGCGAWLNGNPIDFNNQITIPPRLTLSHGQLKGRSYKRAQEILNPSEVVRLRSVVTKTLFVLLHRVDYYFSFPFEVFHGGKPKAWDLAGSMAIMRIGGGIGTDIYGESPLFTGPDPGWEKGHLFAHPAAAAEVLPLLKSAVDERRLKAESGYTRF